jgi:alpha-beta hydrolase superfamily lysophospholipase
MSDALKESRVEELSFEADGLRLRGTLHRPAGGGRPPVVIGCHGLLSDRSSPKQIALAGACNARGLAYFRIDHRGCGESEGRREEPATLEARAADVFAAMRMLAARPDLGRRVGFFGSSLGGSVCLHVAGCRDAGAVVSFAAPIRSRKVHTGRGGGAVSMEQVEMAARLREFELGEELWNVKNALILHGDADEIVPFGHALEIYARVGEPRRLIVQKGGDHFMSRTGDQQEFVRVASAWLAAGLLAASTPVLQNIG